MHNLQQQFEAEQRQGRPKYYESSSEPESQNVATEKSDSEMVDEESDRVPKRITRSQPPQKTRKRGRPVLKENSNREVRETTVAHLFFEFFVLGANYIEGFPLIIYFIIGSEHRDFGR